MTISYSHAFSPVFGLLINVMSQLLIFRYVKKIGLLSSVFFGFFIGLFGVFYIASSNLLNAELDLMEVCGQLSLIGISYAGLGYCYFHFINLGETARRVRIVRELWESKCGLSFDEVKERYGAFHIINIRLQRMIKKEQIVDRNGVYFIRKTTLLWMARILIMMKLMLLGKKSEYG